jgi:hypothetical protein
MDDAAKMETNLRESDTYNPFFEDADPPIGDKECEAFHDKIELLKSPTPSPEKFDESQTTDEF